MTVPQTQRRYNYHNNADGIWCRWTHCSAATSAPDDARCPAECQTSSIEYVQAGND